jgi:hypothetical protein
MGILNRVHEEKIKVKKKIAHTEYSYKHQEFIKNRVTSANDSCTNTLLVTFVGEKTVVTFTAVLKRVSSIMHSWNTPVQKSRHLPEEWILAKSKVGRRE